MSFNFNTLNALTVYESNKSVIWKLKNQYLKASKATSNQIWCLTHSFWENINFPDKLWLNELRIRKHCFSLCFPDGFNTTNISSSVVKQYEINSSFLWSKIIFDASKKTLRKGKFWQERKKMPSFPPPTHPV